MNPDSQLSNPLLHPPANTSPRALWSAIGGLALAVAGLAGTLAYQHRQPAAPALVVAPPVMAPASVFKPKVAAAPVPRAQSATKSIALRRVAPPPVVFSAPVRAPLTPRG